MNNVRSVSLHGHSGNVIDVECRITNGLPSLVIVGLGNKAVDEAKERVRAAFNGSGLSLPKKRITINLAPADVAKEGTIFDLAIAVAILLESKQITADNIKNTVILGELGLNGIIRPVRGVIGCLKLAKEAGFSRCIIPTQNAHQAKLLPNMTIIEARDLKSLYRQLSGIEPMAITAAVDEPSIPQPSFSVDFGQVIGQKRAKRALEIAAAGGHNILLNGPPGTGKSMLAKALVSILPPMSKDEVLEVTHLHSLSSRQYDKLVETRPFRSPHHSASEIAIIGGGQNPRPGEISLSHRGVLFFDEFPEFKRSTIEALRQPLEDQVITVARAKESVVFPADFMLVATSNPCPCGHYGTSKECECPPHTITRYHQKLSGPILDRIDLFVDVDEVEHRRLLDDVQEESSKHIRQRVQTAREVQASRFDTPSAINAGMDNKQMKARARLTKEAKELLDTAAQRLDISARSYMRIVKVARTIADLDKAEDISPSHVSEALQYRRQKVSF